MFGLGKTKQLEQTVEALQQEIAAIKNSAAMSQIIPGSQMWDVFTAGQSASGKTVNEQTAMGVSAVYACTNLIAGAIAGLPLPIYQLRKDGGREKADHDLSVLLNEQANPRMSAAIFWEFIVSSILLHGDGFAKIVRPSAYTNRITALEPIHPLNLVPWVDETGRMYYELLQREGKTTQIPQDDILHFPGAGFNGLRSLSPLKYALKTQAGTAMSADEYSAKFFANSARPDIVLKAPGNLTEDQINLLRESWGNRHQGSANSHMPSIALGGLEVVPITMSAQDSQLIETRKFQIEDIARIFGVPPFMIGQTEKTSSWGSGVEQMSIGFVKYTLQRHLTKIEQEINRKCFIGGKYFCEFNTAGLERGDIKTRYEAHRIALGRAGEPGWVSVNEVRRIENMPPDPDGNKINNGVTDDQAQPTEPSQQ